MTTTRRHRFSRLLYRARRRQAAYRHVWAGRLIFWSGAAAIGVVAVLFANATELVTATLHSLSNRFWFWPFISAPLGGALIVWLTRTYFSGAEGSGIPQVMAEMAEHGDRLPKPLLSARILLGKLGLGIGAIFVGFSAGREGPMVQIGAAFMSLIGRHLPRRLQISRRHLLVAGGAAGIAAAFNTPLAGILFAIEELSRGLEERMSGFIITAIVIAGVVGQAYFGNYTYFGWIDIGHVENNHPLGLLLLAALLCGLAGGAFSRLLLLTTANRLLGPLGRWRAQHPIWFAAGCGLLVAAIGFLANGLTYGTGYREARHLLTQDAQLPWHYGLDKFLATLISFTSGIPGGLFAPSLAIGAGLGQNLYSLVDTSYLPGMTSVLCMAGFLAAVTQTPITAFVIVMEMVSGYGMVIDLMIVTLLASGISRAFCPPLYRTLALRYLSQAGPPTPK
ncbi:MAG: chloride channel protein [Hydrogenophilales bacterium CG03_land_8_20_14_0_80_62_28]|nr:chloride channel protein [Betaproteobacteria bacterium]OIO78708.1 MAG: chloride channel protein [Hydrogenophilaceae bacterium CG1_02_62_390]PIV24291.1 MAG: chloride channel protein [Hydrogenophilales bacterium CG03_land_8_20_14_0_80_62_28]PIW39426.1 MAG: chloride channel protein [Hydrogenophilales bacterium CG15_BIG_FIL_POST_REV_8_21_14_020_62_31]PIW71686.1 MAG: chloride channel protein [Hydrogenophilales bacterium CG12_big_fil_rev_8_21_14_0_65_61_21]PIX02066.1 MAG: chloride channel protein